MGKLTKAIGTAVLASVTIVGVANAVRRVPALQGRATAGSNQQFTNADIYASGNEGLFSQTSETTIFFHMPLPFDNSGSKNVTFTINTSATSDYCRAITINRNSTGFVASPNRTVTTPNTLQTLTTNSITVGSNNFFFAECRLTNAAGLTLFQYEQ